jgi:serine phosphatase RsbU (regulator of sigma subunit)
MTVDLESGEVTPLGGLEDGGLPLGIYEDADYDLHTSTIPPNSRLLVYSDGLEEAFPDGNRDFGQYGIEGIEESLTNSIGKPLTDAMQALFDDSHEFTNGSGRHDDTSVVLLERTAEVTAEV